MVYLASSKLSTAIIGNLGFACALTIYKVLTRIFLGTLRDSEVERINDKISQAIVETLLAMTIFREDFTPSFISMFVILSFLKIFHWLVQDRVDFVETTPDIPYSQHFSLATFSGLLLGIDILFLRFTLSHTLRVGVSVYLLFAFEYAILASTMAASMVKYSMSAIDMALEGRWEGKGAAVFYLQLTLDMLHLIVYFAFFATVFSTYGIPLHLVRDLYWTVRNFQNRVRAFLRYRKLTANMDEQFPDASPEDVERVGGVCIVCREDLVAQSGRNKKLGCGHVFHLHCLRSWLERQQNCPICRAAVTPGQGPTTAPARQRPAHGRQQQPGEDEWMRDIAQRLAQGQLREAVNDYVRQRDGESNNESNRHEESRSPAPPREQQVQVRVTTSPPPPGVSTFITLRAPPTPEQHQLAMAAAMAAVGAMSHSNSPAQSPPPLPAGGDSESTRVAMIASAEAVEKMLEEQLKGLKTYLEQLKQGEQQPPQHDEAGPSTSRNVEAVSETLDDQQSSQAELRRRRLLRLVQGQGDDPEHQQQ